MDVKRYWIDGDLNEITSAEKQPHDVVLASDFDRVTAELAALQSRLNETDAENDRLRTLLRSMTCGYREAITNGHDRIIFLGGECDSPEKMLNDNPSYAQAWAALENKHEQQ